MCFDNVIFLRPDEPVALDVPMPVVGGDGAAAIWADDAVEEMVVALAAMEAAWVSCEFSRLVRVSETLEALAAKLGIATVARIAGQLRDAVAAGDDVAIAAIMGRLVRVGEASLATILEIAYRQV